MRATAARRVLDRMSVIQADVLAKVMFGSSTQAHLTRYGCRLYVRRGALAMSLLARGDSWHETFLTACAARGITPEFDKFEKGAVRR